MKKLRDIFLKLINLDVVKFALVGAISTAIDFLLLNFFIYLGLNLFWAIFFSYFFGAVNGYLFNNNWTYQHLQKPNNIRGFLQYATISFVGLGLTEGVVNILYHALHANLNIDKLAAVVIVFAWNFFANRIFTFKTSTPPKEVTV